MLLLRGIATLGNMAQPGSFHVILAGILIIIGFTATTAQIVFLRELVVISYRFQAHCGAFCGLTKPGLCDASRNCLNACLPSRPEVRQVTDKAAVA